jgi:cell division protein FtsB
VKTSFPVIRFVEKIKQRIARIIVSEAKQNFRQSISLYFSRSGRRVATVAAIVFAALLGYHAIFGANGISAYQQKRHQHQVLQQEIHQLQQENGRLQDHVQHLQSDPDAIEHEARVILRYAKPGEVIYSLSDKAQATTHAK